MISWPMVAGLLIAGAVLLYLVVRPLLVRPVTPRPPEGGQRRRPSPAARSARWRRAEALTDGTPSTR